MGAVASRVASASGLKGLVSRAGLPLQVDDDFDKSDIKEPSKVCSTSRVLITQPCLAEEQRLRMLHSSSLAFQSRLPACLLHACHPSAADRLVS